MKIHVDVKPNSRCPGVELVGERLVVRVKEPPKEGKANQAVLRAVAEHFGIAMRDVKLVSGEAARHKVIEIPER